MASTHFPYNIIENIPSFKYDEENRAAVHQSLDELQLHFSFPRYLTTVRTGTSSVCSPSYLERRLYLLSVSTDAVGFCTSPYVYGLSFV